MGSLPLPLPPNYFLQPELTYEEKNSYIQLADETTREVISSTILRGGPIAWTRHSSDAKSKCSIYKGQDPTAPAGVMSYMVTMQLEATLAEVTALFAAYTQEDLNEYRRTVAPDLLEVHQLYVLATPTEQRPNRLVSIKYMVARSLAPSITHHRDWCCLDSNRDFESNGRRGFCRAMRSIDLACVPSMRETHNFVRAVAYRSGFVFLEGEPGYINAFQLLQFDPKGNIPTWLSDIGLKVRCRSFQTMAKLISEGRLSRQKLLDDDQLVPKATRNRCQLCSTKFRPIFTPKARCRACGEVMCRQCAKHYNVKKNGFIQRVRVCSSCIADVQTRTLRGSLGSPSPPSDLINEIDSDIIANVKQVLGEDYELATTATVGGSYEELSVFTWDSMPTTRDSSF
ncbi:unnamed protein product [Aphanomyces euteiches]|uniref:FYVE-type domain-containing protein n=1 Tax=Aphanomyces euteiches TaxID=100861 RepID=A0A6G0X016_9STRA|nr:hypothetical protein Ae201684_009923 [Aphanomyces euteiches]KAH9139893.1 hypothetical protein AeRB84_015830 [Aphanomyces euteiches]